jgi:alpha-L-rhamnosidase
MGWTGDAQVFSGTACYNMDTYGFFNKYLFDLGKEQESRGGMVPYVVPAVNLAGGGSSAWGDAATIIPWNVYLHYGDKAILKQQFESMKGWVDYIKRVDDASGAARLWTVGFHYGDWLALDGDDPKSAFGGTETSFISSAYYAYSAGLVAKAAKVLGKNELSKEYEKLSKDIKEAIGEEYFTKKGRLAINTQTAHIISLFMDLVPKRYRARTIKDLKAKLNKDKNYLKTGFVGTTYACRTLSENGLNELAYTLLLNKDYPSWIYSVTMGATTIWERWNSILPDGKISDTGMNSLNHYAYGSIVEWMYRNMAGINPVEEAPGFKKARLAPMPDLRFKYVKASLASAAGLYESQWSIDDKEQITYKFVVPFNATARVVLPNVKLEDVKLNGSPLKNMELPSWERGNNTCIDLYAGRWEFTAKWHSYNL